MTLVTNEPKLRAAAPPYAREWRRLHRRLYGINWFKHIPGLIILVVGGWLMVPGDSIATMSLGSLLVGTGTLLTRWVFRQGAKNAASRLADDPRPRILYIRAFDDDDQHIRKSEAWQKSVNMMAWPEDKRFEEALSYMMQPLGPLVAIGQPNERLPRLGAVRIYPRDEPWQDAFKRLHHECAFVAVQAGHGLGLRWEIGQVFQPEHFKPVLLCFPTNHPETPPSEEAYSWFRHQCESLTGASLPPRLDGARFVWCRSPSESETLAPTAPSFGQWGIDKQLPGFSGVYRIFDEVSPGVGDITQDFLRRGNRAGKAILIAFGLLLLIIVLSVLFA